MPMILKNTTILAIDDDFLTLLSLSDFLQSHCKQLFLETNIKSAVELAIKVQPDIILLDILMNEMNGYVVCTWLKAQQETQAIPVIFISTLSRAVDKVKGFDVGGVDYITKPFEAEEVVARIENCLRLHSQINQQKNPVPAPSAENIELYQQLKKKELEILHLYALGKKRHEIAVQLCLSENTVKTHLRNLFAKLGIKTRAEAVEKAQVMRLL